MIRCMECGSNNFSTELMERYEALDMVEIPVALINGVRVHTCKNCGEVTEEIPQMGNLVLSIAHARIHYPFAFTGRDISMLRNALEMDYREFAELVGSTVNGIQNWEEYDQAMGGAASKAIRNAVASWLAMEEPDLFSYDDCYLSGMPTLPGEMPMLELRFGNKEKFQKEAPEDMHWNLALVA